MNKLIGLLFFFMCLGCNNKPTCNVNPKVLKTNDSIIALYKLERGDSMFLKRMEEPKLESSKEEEIYRFTIRTTFGNTYIYKINKKADNYFITSKSYLNYKDDDLKHERRIMVNRLGKEQKKIISPENWITIKNSLDALNFWNFPVIEKNPPLYLGEGYIIEGYTSKKNECTNRNYHIVLRVCPNDSTLYKSIFNKVIKLAKNQKHN